MNISIKVNGIEFRILNIVFYVGLSLGALFSRLPLSSNYIILYKLVNQSLYFSLTYKIRPKNIFL